MKCRSEWQRPATEVRIRTSRGPGFGRLTSSMTRGLLTSWRTAAFIEHSLSLFCFERGCSLRCQDQFANLAHASITVAEQQCGDLLLHGIFRQPERIARRYPVIDHQPRQQQPSRIATHVVNAMCLPGERDGAGNMIEQAGGTARIGLIVGLSRDLACEADRAIGESVKPVAPS